MFGSLDEKRRTEESIRALPKSAVLVLKKWKKMHALVAENLETND